MSVLSVLLKFQICIDTPIQTQYKFVCIQMKISVLVVFLYWSVLCMYSYILVDIHMYCVSIDKMLVLTCIACICLYY